MDRNIRDPHWWPRGALLAVLGWFFVQHLRDPGYSGIYGGLNLVVHEAGHALFSWSGSTLLTVAGGTLMEVGVPVLAGAAFLRQRDPFAVTVALFWTATVLLDVSTYVGDARSQILPLVSLGDGSAIHDWNYLLGRAGLLEWDGTLARVVRRMGLALMVTALAAGAWVTARIRTASQRARDETIPPSDSS